MLLAMAFLLAAPLVAWSAGGSAYRVSTGVERAERAQRLPTEAVLLADANSGTVGFAVVPQVPVAARWTAADGTERVGAVVVSANASAGTVIPIWTDHAGDVVGPPREHDQTVMRASVAGAAAVLGLTALLAGVRLAVRRHLDRRRMAVWDAEWAWVAARWTGRPQ